MEYDYKREYPSFAVARLPSFLQKYHKLMISLCTHYLLSCEGSAHLVRRLNTARAKDI